MKFRNNGFLGVNRDGYIVGEHIRFSRVVCNLGNHIIADTQTIDIDLTVFIGHIGFGEGIAGNIRTFNAEGEALKLGVLGGFLNAEAAGLRLVDEALAGLIFNNNRRAVLLD